MGRIIVGFSRPKKWKPFAWLIMKAYGIDYDHVYVKFRSEKFDRNIIYQASSTMVNFMSDEIFEEENLIVDEFEVEITDENLVGMIQFAMDNAGRPYGVKEALGLGIVRIAELLGKTIKNPFKDGGSTYVCSALGAYILKHYTALNIPVDPEDVSPPMLRAYLMSIKLTTN